MELSCVTPDVKTKRQEKEDPLRTIWSSSLKNATSKLMLPVLSVIYDADRKRKQTFLISKC